MVNPTKTVKRTITCDGGTYKDLKVLSSFLEQEEEPENHISKAALAALAAKHYHHELTSKHLKLNTRLKIYDTYMM